MPDENKVGGLEAKVDILVSQNSKIFDTVNQTQIDMATHQATSDGRFTLMEERHDGLRGDVDDLEEKVDKHRLAHKALAEDTPSQKKIMVALAAVASVAGIIGSFVGSIFKGTPHP